MIKTKIKLKFIGIVILLLNVISINCFAQNEWNNSYKSTHRKREKIIPKFPPQFHTSDTIKKTTEIVSRNGVVAEPIKAKPEIIVKSYDSHGNEMVITKEKGYKIVTTTIILPPTLNKKFNADTINRDSISIAISKSRYRLSVYYKGKLLTAYKCVFGSKSLDSKEYEGDKRTPEGSFKIINIKPHAEWTNFMLLDYPNQESYKIFNENKSKGKIPANASIGGLVGIHGIWKDGDDVIDKKHNWTDGCIALKNADVAELAKIVQNGTVVVVKR